MQAPVEAQPPALAIRGLVKIFGNLVAVANLNLDIPKGSFYGFVGPNGAGKTTTLNMATGLLTPDQGTAYVNGIDVWKDDTAARAQLGVMPDGMRLLDRLSGPDFLVHGHPGSDRCRKETHFGLLSGYDEEDFPGGSTHSRSLSAGS